MLVSGSGFRFFPPAKVLSIPKYFSVRFPGWVLGALLASATLGEAATSILVSIPDQKLALVRDGERIAQYRISTSRFGLGDRPRSFSTPLGRLEVAERIGHGLPAGTVFKGRHPTGEVLEPNARGRDPIVTRILHLRGLEPQNVNAFSRAIYIHGTPAERALGKPESYGCIRMRSEDMIALFDATPVGTTVEILDEPLRRALPGVLAATRSGLPAPAAGAAHLAGVSPEARTSAKRQVPFTASSRKAHIAARDGGARAQKMHFEMTSVSEMPSLGGAAALQANSVSARDRHTGNILSVGIW